MKRARKSSNPLTAQRSIEKQEPASLEDAEKLVAEFFGSGASGPTDTDLSPLDQAQELIYTAWETNNRAKRIKLAKQALKISEDCADAYSLLAEESAQTPQEERELYEKAVAAGERALGEDFNELRGHFWGYIWTRPYMRARFQLALLLWEMDELEAAAGHMSDMLELNPNDNQGIRDMYINLLLELPDDGRFDKLAKRYRGSWGAAWKYALALHEFRRKGRGGKADKLLRDAISGNAHVPAFLLQPKRTPQLLPDYYSPGDEYEAAFYVQDAGHVWHKIPGALEWLRDMTAK